MVCTLYIEDANLLVNHTLHTLLHRIEGKTTAFPTSSPYCCNYSVTDKLWWPYDWCTSRVINQSINPKKDWDRVIYYSTKTYSCNSCIFSKVRHRHVTLVLNLYLIFNPLWLMHTQYLWIDCSVVWQKHAFSVNVGGFNNTKPLTYQN